MTGVQWIPLKNILESLDLIGGKGEFPFALVMISAIVISIIKISSLINLSLIEYDTSLAECAE